LKAKDIDNQRLNKRILKLEKLIEMNKNFDGPGQRIPRGEMDMMDDRDDQFDETQDFGNMPINRGFGITE